MILDAYEDKKPLISNQGQGMDGYTALATFVGLAKKVRNYHEKKLDAHRETIAEYNRRTKKQI